MLTTGSIQVYVLATAITTVVWILYVLWFTYPPTERVRADETHPLIRRIVQALWWVAVSDLIGVVTITGISLLRNYFGLPNLVDTAPSWVPAILFIQYAFFYAVAATPTTILYILVTALDDLEARVRKT